MRQQGDLEGCEHYTGPRFDFVLAELMEIFWVVRERPVSVGLKIHAESPANGSSWPASHKSSTLKAHQMAVRGELQTKSKLKTHQTAPLGQLRANPPR